MRSLLQKAVRRGDIELVKKIIIYLLNSQDQDWVRKRLAVMTFEECWTYGLYVNFENKAEFLLKQYLNLTASVKNKDASGLGLLAYNLSEGDKSVFWDLDKDKIKDINYVSHAIKRPNDFWKWAKDQIKDDFRRSTLVNKSFDGFKMASWPWDKAFTIASAYLAIINNVPKLNYSKVHITVPYWVGIDKHTDLGKKTIKLAAQEQHVNEEIALWLSFYLEGAICNELAESFWWMKEFNWKLHKLNISMIKAENIWKSLKLRIEELLIEESCNIKQKLNLTEINDINAFEQMKIF